MDAGKKNCNRQYCNAYKSRRGKDQQRANINKTEMCRNPQPRHESKTAYSNFPTDAYSTNMNVSALSAEAFMQQCCSRQVCPGFRQQQRSAERPDAGCARQISIPQASTGPSAGKEAGMLYMQTLSLQQTCVHDTKGAPGKPNAGAATAQTNKNSAQILFVEPNFTDTPSEYDDMFYDCSSEFDTPREGSMLSTKQTVSRVCSIQDPTVFHGGLKQIAATSRKLLCELEASCCKDGRRPLSPIPTLGSIQTSCAPLSIKQSPPSRTVYLELTARLGNGNSNTVQISPYTLRIEPITFNLPVKLMLRSGSAQLKTPRSPQSSGITTGVAESMEPIRTATITAPKTCVSGQSADQDIMQDFDTGPITETAAAYYAPPKSPQDFMQPFAMSIPQMQQQQPQSSYCPPDPNAIWPGACETIRLFESTTPVLVAPVMRGPEEQTSMPRMCMYQPPSPKDLWPGPCSTIRLFKAEEIKTGGYPHLPMPTPTAKTLATEFTITETQATFVCPCSMRVQPETSADKDALEIMNFDTKLSCTPLGSGCPCTPAQSYVSQEYCTMDSCSYYKGPQSQLPAKAAEPLQLQESKVCSETQQSKTEEFCNQATCEAFKSSAEKAPERLEMVPEGLVQKSCTKQTCIHFQGSVSKHDECCTETTCTAQKPSQPALPDLQSVLQELPEVKKCCNKQTCLHFQGKGGEGCCTMEACRAQMQKKEPTVEAPITPVVSEPLLPQTGKKLPCNQETCCFLGKTSGGRCCRNELCRSKKDVQETQSQETQKSRLIQPPSEPELIQPPSEPQILQRPQEPQLSQAPMATELSQTSQLSQAPLATQTQLPQALLTPQSPAGLGCTRETCAIIGNKINEQPTGGTARSQVQIEPHRACNRETCSVFQGKPIIISESFIQTEKECLYESKEVSKKNFPVAKSMASSENAGEYCTRDTCPDKQQPSQPKGPDAASPDCCTPETCPAIAAKQPSQPKLDYCTRDTCPALAAKQQPTQPKLADVAAPTGLAGCCTRETCPVFSAKQQPSQPKGPDAASPDCCTPETCPAIAAKQQPTQPKGPDVAAPTTSPDCCTRETCPALATQGQIVQSSPATVATPTASAEYCTRETCPVLAAQRQIQQSPVTATSPPCCPICGSPNRPASQHACHDQLCPVTQSQAHSCHDNICSRVNAKPDTPVKILESGHDGRHCSFHNCPTLAKLKETIEKCQEQQARLNSEMTKLIKTLNARISDTQIGDQRVAIPQVAPPTLPECCSCPATRLPLSGEQRAQHTAKAKPSPTAKPKSMSGFAAPSPTVTPGPPIETRAANLVSKMSSETTYSATQASGTLFACPHGLFVPCQLCQKTPQRTPKALLPTPLPAKKAKPSCICHPLQVRTKPVPPEPPCKPPSAPKKQCSCAEKAYTRDTAAIMPASKAECECCERKFLLGSETLNVLPQELLGECKCAIPPEIKIEPAVELEKEKEIEKEAPPKEKYRLALPQHKDLEMKLCSPCRYHPSPLIDKEGNAFCPRNCGCCLCPWRSRKSDSETDAIMHQKIRVCSCRNKATLFSDPSLQSGHCSVTSYVDVCPCREKAEAKHLELYGYEMWENEDLSSEAKIEATLDEVVEIRPLAQSTSTPKQ